MYKHKIEIASSIFELKNKIMHNEKSGWEVCGLTQDNAVGFIVVFKMPIEDKAYVKQSTYSNYSPEELKAELERVIKCPTKAEYQNIFYNA